MDQDHPCLSHCFGLLSRIAGYFNVWRFLFQGIILVSKCETVRGPSFGGEPTWMPESAISELKSLLSSVENPSRVIPDKNTKSPCFRSLSKPFVAFENKTPSIFPIWKLIILPRQRKVVTSNESTKNCCDHEGVGANSSLKVFEDANPHGKIFVTLFLIIILFSLRR